VNRLAADDEQIDSALAELETASTSWSLVPPW
jgi:hypothetical protein